MGADASNSRIEGVAHDALSSPTTTSRCCVKSDHWIGDAQRRIAACVDDGCSHHVDEEPVVMHASGTRVEDISEGMWSNIGGRRIEEPVRIDRP